MADKYHLAHPQRFLATMECESMHFQVLTGQSYVPNRHGPNGRENSWGPAQFHFPTDLRTASGTTITKAVARDPEQAIEAAAYNFSIGNARQWSCYSKVREMKGSYGTG